jgi:DNA gyrase subunit B
MIVKRRKEGGLLATLAMEDGFGANMLKDKKALKGFLEDVRKHMKAMYPEITPVEFIIDEDTEHNCLMFKCISKRNGLQLETVVDKELLFSPEFRELRKTGVELKSIGEPPYEIILEGSPRRINTFQGLLDNVFEIGKKGLYIQRYKGLGEMNPEQLWETTMDPEKRTLLQVKVEDMIETDEVFTKLMGDEVEPRREFIEKHALDVVNLDI